MSKIQETTSRVPQREATPIERIQAGSGLAFGLFLVLHLTTTISASGGILVYDRTLALFRGLYRPHLVFELVVIALSGLIHIGCAVGRMAKRRNRTARRVPGWMRAHRFSGYFLLATVIGHAAATRVLPAFGTGPTATGAADFAYVSYAVIGWPWFFAPYYIALGLCGAIHLGLGVRLALPVLLPGRVISGPPSCRYLLGVGAFALLVSMGVGAIIARSPTAPRQRFAEYRSLYERVAPFLLRHRADETRAIP